MAYKFTTSTYIRFKGSDLNIVPTEYTISMWIKLLLIPTNYIALPLCVRTNDSGPGGLHTCELYLPNNNNGINTRLLSNARKSNGANITAEVLDANLVRNRWYHILATAKNQNSMNVYIDGALRATTSMVGMDMGEVGPGITQGNDFNISRCGYTSNSGIAFSDVAFWYKELTPSEIRLIYNSRIKRIPLQIQPTFLKVYCPFDDVSRGITARGNYSQMLNKQYATSLENPSPIGDPDPYSYP